MATWITHLRIAENLLPQIPELDEVSFLYGNLAPDSGLPNEDWTLYDPPKDVTHFLNEGHDGVVINDLVFYRNYLDGVEIKKRIMEYSFRLGYYIHLVTDQLWWNKIGITMEAINQNLFVTHSRGEAIGLLKTDWYDLDHKFLRDHPGYAVWDKFFVSDIPQIPLPFMPQNAFEIQMKYIKEYYTTTDPDRVLDRDYPYLNMNTLDRFIEETSAEIIKIMKLLASNAHTAAMNSSMHLLSNNELRAYDPPLGDQNE